MAVHRSREERDWPVTWDKRDSATLEDYIKDFNYIFETTDERRDVLDIFLNVVKHTSRTAEGVRRDQPQQIALALSDAVMWLLSLKAKVDSTSDKRDKLFAIPMSLSEAIWTKYPRRCPVCFGGLWEMPEIRAKLLKLSQTTDFIRLPERRMLRKLQEAIPLDAIMEAVALLKPYAGSREYDRCRCLATPDTEERTEGHGVGKRKKQAYDLVKKLVRREYARKIGFPTQFGLTEITNMFSNIYNLNGKRAHPSDIVNHLQEEVGEVAGALTDIYSYHPKEDPKPSLKELDLRRMELAEEIADVISWFFSCLMKARMTFDSVKEFRKALGTDIEIRVENPTMGDIIWANWGRKELNHLWCIECKQPDKCKCGWRLARTDDQLLTELGLE